MDSGEWHVTENEGQVIFVLLLHGFQHRIDTFAAGALKISKFYKGNLARVTPKDMVGNGSLGDHLGRVAIKSCRIIFFACKDEESQNAQCDYCKYDPFGSCHNHFIIAQFYGLLQKIRQERYNVEDLLSFCLEVKEMRNLDRVGGMLWVDFDMYCRRIVYSMAQGIRRDAATATIRTKTSYAGVAGADIVTTADLNAQALFVNMATRLLPGGVGWIGEEEGLRKPSDLAGCSVVMTVDPADGTLSLSAAIQAGRLPLPGEVSAMLGVLVDGVPVASYICDVGNLVTYVRMPFASRVMRLGANGARLRMRPEPVAKPLRSGTLLRHGTRSIINPLTRRLVESGFRTVQRGSDSIGLSLMRVFTGEFAALLRVAGGYTTPWDDVPIEAMCRTGQVVAFRVNANGFQQIHLEVLDQVIQRAFDVVYVARGHLAGLKRFGRVTLLD